MQIFVSKIKNRIAFKRNTGSKLELLSPEAVELLRSANKNIDKNKDGENVPRLESG